MRIKDLCEKIIDNRGKTPPLVEKGLPLIESQCFSTKDFCYSNDAVKFVSTETYSSFRSGTCKTNDILVTLVGNIGHCALVKNDFAIAQNIIALRIEETKANPKFIFYLTKTSEFKQKCMQLNRSSVQPSLNANDFLNLIIDLPDRATQDKIAEILSNIDNQIERNNEMTKRLQVLGNTIYSRNIKETNNFFTIDESKIKTGKQDANFATPNGKYKFFTCSEDSFLCDNYEFNGKNILIAGNGNFNVKFYDGKFNAYQRTYVIKDNDIYGNLYYTYSYNTQSLLKGANGSIIKFMTIGMLKDIQIPEFSKEVNNILNNVVYEINKIKQENDNLNQLKSKLLPLLINGQIDI